MGLQNKNFLCVNHAFNSSLNEPQHACNNASIRTTCQNNYKNKEGCTSKHDHLKMSLTAYKIENAPATVHYIPNFISEDDEAFIMKHVYSAPKPKWTCLSNRRLQDYGGVPHKNGMIPEKVPDWLKTYNDKIAAYNVFGGNKPNHVLVNEYLPNQGIMPHTDGPLFYPTVTTISCGSHTVLEILENDAKRDKVCDIFLERRSLVVLQDDVYSKYLHSISERDEDVITKECVNAKQCGGEINVGTIFKRDTRISLTIRYVPKVCKIKLWK